MSYMNAQRRQRGKKGEKGNSWPLVGSHAEALVCNSEQPDTEEYACQVLKSND